MMPLWRVNISVSELSMFGRSPLISPIVLAISPVTSPEPSSHRNPHRAESIALLANQMMIANPSTIRNILNAFPFVRRIASLKVSSFEEPSESIWYHVR